MDDCIFCKIASGEIPSNKAYEDDKVLVFHDIAPAAPTHLLAIPKAHIQSAEEVDERNAELIGHLFAVMAKLSKDLKLDSGFRIVTNIGQDGGQTVGHLHFHLLAGRQLAWPPG
ncbi:MAG: histidine triad nucleotide-binding protein [Oscillospiraceae bacterium]|nr:histidine triad nucleotide-binding protein [Oscillospiraceae bacterium]